MLKLKWTESVFLIPILYLSDNNADTDTATNHFSLDRYAITSVKNYLYTANTHACGLMVLIFSMC